MKVKGIELMQMIADGKIKEGAKLKNNVGTDFIYKNGTLYRYNYKDRYENILSGGVYSVLIYLLNEQTFEILEDKTEEIKKLDEWVTRRNGEVTQSEAKIIEIGNKLNELVKAVNRLNKPIDTSKETNCMTD